MGILVEHQLLACTWVGSIVHIGGIIDFEPDRLCSNANMLEFDV